MNPIKIGNDGLMEFNKKLRCPNNQCRNCGLEHSTIIKPTKFRIIHYIILLFLSVNLIISTLTFLKIKDDKLKINTVEQVVCKPNISEINKNYTKENCFKFAKQEFPRDKRIRISYYNELIASARYMIKADDLEIKKLVQKKFPNKFHTQKFSYEQQCFAKLYMFKQVNDKNKRMAVKRFPNDYNMQKNIYDELKYSY